MRVKYDQRKNLLIWLGFAMSALIIIVFIWNLRKSSPGEVTTALATIIAAILALIAGVLVYRAAMSSRDDTQKREREEDRRRKLNLFLKAQHMAYILIQVSPLRSNSARMAFSKLDAEGRSVPGHILSETIHIPRPRQLEEIWQNLSDFPANAVYELRSITQYFDHADEYIKNTAQIPDGMVSPLINYYSNIVDSALILEKIMSSTELIRNYCVESPDRYEILHVPPDEEG